VARARTSQAEGRSGQGTCGRPGTPEYIRTDQAVDEHQITPVHTPGGTRLSRENGVIARISSMVAAGLASGIGPQAYNHG
jgi:hypothetical protein